VTCVCGKCAPCRLERKRRHARDRKARQRAADKFAEEPPPLLALMTQYTEDPDWIERKLQADDRDRAAARQTSRCCLGRYGEVNRGQQ
jgi:hypothetical protein